MSLAYLARLLGAAAWLPVALLCLTALGGPASKSGNVRNPFALRARILLAIAQDTDWPSEAFANSQTFVFGVLGEDELSKSPEFMNVINGGKVKERSVVVKFFKEAEEVTGCQMLYISQDQKNLRKALKAVENSTTLTAAEIDDFLKFDGMLNLFEGKGRLCWEVNEPAARKVNIRFGLAVLKNGKT